MLAMHVCWLASTFTGGISLCISLYYDARQNPNQIFRLLNVCCIHCARYMTYEMNSEHNSVIHNHRCVLECQVTLLTRNENTANKCAWYSTMEMQVASHALRLHMQQFCVCMWCGL